MPAHNNLYHALHPGGGVNMAAALMIYSDNPQVRQAGMEAVRQTWKTMTIDLGLAWNQPVMVDIDNTTGKPKAIHEDYYHNLSLWVIPPAWFQQDLKSFCAQGGLVDRILNAAKP